MDEESVNQAERECTSPKYICDMSAQRFSKILDFRAFVDKTLFIKAFLQAEDHVIVTLAPKGFGRSTNMDMVIEFVRGNRKLFEDNQLIIWKEEREFFNKYCQNNPIIHVNFWDISGTTYDAFLESMLNLVHRAFTDHRYLIKKVGGKYSWSDEKLKSVGTIERFERYWKKSEDLSRLEVINGLKVLSHSLSVYHDKPVYVFIDDFDDPVMDLIMATYHRDEVRNEIINFINALLFALFNNNKHVKKGLINASVRIAEFPHFKYYEFLRSSVFSPYFGFTDKEVNTLFEIDEFKKFKNDRIQKWYGYRLSHTTDDAIYNNCSVLNYLVKSERYNKPMFDTYWTGSKYINNLNKLFAVPVIQTLIEKLIDGQEIEIKTIKILSKEDIITLQKLINQNPNTVGVSHAHLFLQFLVENGYLNYTSIGDYTATIVVPNAEIKRMLKDKCYNARLFRRKFPREIYNYSDTLTLLLSKRDKATFIRFARAVCGLFDGAPVPQYDSDLCAHLFTWAWNVRVLTVHHIEQDVQGTDRNAIIVVRNQVAMIIVCNVGDESSSEEAHTLSQGCATAFNDYKNVTVKIFAGIHMSEEREVSITYTVDNSAKETVTNDD